MGTWYDVLFGCVGRGAMQGRQGIDGWVMRRVCRGSQCMQDDNAFEVSGHNCGVGCRDVGVWEFLCLAR